MVNNIYDWYIFGAMDRDKNMMVIYTIAMNVYIGGLEVAYD